MQPGTGLLCWKVLRPFQKMHILYNICVKVSHYKVLKDCKETKCSDVFRPDVFWLLEVPVQTFY